MDEDDWTVPCPHCGKDIYDDVDQCPYCRNYISSADFRKPYPTWMVILIVVTALALLLPFLSFIN